MGYTMGFIHFVDELLQERICSLKGKCFPLGLDYILDGIFIIKGSKQEVT